MSQSLKVTRQKKQKENLEGRAVLAYHPPLPLERGAAEDCGEQKPASCTRSPTSLRKGLVSAGGLYLSLCSFMYSELNLLSQRRPGHL